MSNRNSSRCGCDRRPRGCLNSVGGARGWYRDRWPICPDVNGCYDGDDCGRVSGGIFTAAIPMAVAANGVIPLNGSCCDRDIQVNNGLITLSDPGTYLATVTARVPEGTALDSTITLNANDASQYSALMVLCGAGPASATAQALFDVCDRTVVSLRSSEALNITEASPQPLFTLSLVKVE